MFKKILVPLDGSTAAEAAIQMACELAGLVAAEILLVRCTTLQFDLGYPPGFPIPHGAMESEYKHCEKYLRDHVQQLSERGFQAHFQVLGSGDAASIIVGVASERSSELIVLSSHGRSGLSHLMLGSVAEKVCRTAPCPVLVVGPATALLREAKEKAHHTQC